MPSPLQTNTQIGLVVLQAANPATIIAAGPATLATMDGSGNVILTTSGAQPLYIIDDVPTNDGSADAANTTVRPLYNMDRNVRVYVGAVQVNPGQEAQSDGSGNAVPASSGNWVFGILEDTAAAIPGQLGLFRPVLYKK